MSQPHVKIELDKSPALYEPGEMLSFEFRVGATPAGDPSAIEVSILWYTEGKGDEEISVHFFDRVANDTGSKRAAQSHRYNVALPNTPLSYDGVIVKIRWCVRVRVFVGRGRDFVTEEHFRLGDVPAASAITP
jgi:hypothetical protein